MRACLLGRWWIYWAGWIRLECRRWSLLGQPHFHVFTGQSVTWLGAACVGEAVTWLGGPGVEHAGLVTNRSQVWLLPHMLLDLMWLDVQRALKPIHLLINSFIHSFTHLLFCSFIHFLIYYFIYSFINLFLHPFVRLFIHSFIPPSICSFIHSFIHSFMWLDWFCCCLHGWK
jgi:hypothetical protein